MENNITNKELFYHYAESLGIKINDAQRLMVLALASREEALPQAVSGSLQDRLFELANDFAKDKQGDVALKLHSIHNVLQ